MSIEVPRRVRLFSALGCRDFRVFWTGFLVSMTRNWMQMFADAPGDRLIVPAPAS
jgi:hypothetical protein